MNKSDARPARSRTSSDVDHRKPLPRKFRERRVDVGCLQRQMMQTGTVSFQVPANGALVAAGIASSRSRRVPDFSIAGRCKGLKKLELAVADSNKCDTQTTNDLGRTVVVNDAVAIRGEAFYGRVHFQIGLGAFDDQSSFDAKKSVAAPLSALATPT